MAVFILMLLSFGCGRYSITGSSKTVETKAGDKKTSDDTQKNEHKVTREVTKPDGTKVVTVVDDTNVVKHDTADISSSSSLTKETTRGGKTLTVSALAGTKVSFSSPLTPVYGGMISKEILGPISVGAWGLSNGVCGVSVGLGF